VAQAKQEFGACLILIGDTASGRKMNTYSMTMQVYVKSEGEIAAAIVR
jgi:hypothetical protein